MSKLGCRLDNKALYVCLVSSSLANKVCMWGYIYVAHPNILPRAPYTHAKGNLHNNTSQPLLLYRTCLQHHLSPVSSYHQFINKDEEDEKGQQSLFGFFVCLMRLLLVFWFGFMFSCHSFGPCCTK